MNDTSRTLIETGSWGDDLQWKLYKTTIAPPEELCSAVMCVAMVEGKVVLARSARGWGMLGGHVDEGESRMRRYYVKHSKKAASPLTVTNSLRYAKSGLASQ